MRPLSVIAEEIIRTWKHPYFAAVPYLSAMLKVEKCSDTFWNDDGFKIVRYFLGNATRWRGADARRIKTELKQHLGETK